MQLRKTFRLLYQAITSGLAAAFLLMLMSPQWLQRPSIAADRDEHDAPSADAPSTHGSHPEPYSYAAAVARAAPAVVNIHAAKAVVEPPEPFPDEPRYEPFFRDSFASPGVHREPSLGSGVIVSENGHVLTNHHVIESAEVIRVLLQDRRQAAARVVGTDPDTDLAVLKIELADVPIISLQTAHYPRVGDVVLAIGNPFGMGQTVTQGIISATGRSGLGINTFEDFIQTDAAINPGNSGGALINPHGELIGINSAVFSRIGGQGIGFAIPAEVATHVMTQILDQGYVIRGWLGVEVQELPRKLVQSADFAETTGVVVSRVMRHSPAHFVGLQPGDLITHVDQQPVLDRHAAVTAIARVPPGNQVALRVVRDGRSQNMQATVSQRPAEPNAVRAQDSHAYRAAIPPPSGARSGG
ncbi:MAG: S1C family serine protease [Gammaproteobacteria bacterium]